MSDLQIVLIVLGALIIAGVVIYNWMQERKLRDNIAEEFVAPKKDVLIDDFYIDTDAYVEKEFANDAHKGKVLEKLREVAPPEADKSTYAESPAPKVEPAIEEDDESHEAAEAAEVEQQEAEQQNVATSKRAPAEIKVPEDAPVKDDVVVAPSPLPDDLHPQIDLTAFLYATKNIKSQALTTMIEAAKQDVGLPILLHGLDVNDVWHALSPASKSSKLFKQAACSIQLADRTGPVSTQVLNKFQYAIENIGLELNAHVEWQGSGDAAQRAIELDKFCMEVDQLVSVHLVQGGAPIHGTKFKGLAEANDLKLNASGKFCYFAKGEMNTPQFVLINTDNQPFTAEGLRNSVVIGATFQIEIPKIANCEQAFNHMVTVAQKMANSMGARMVDDNQKPLGDIQIEKIRQQLNAIHATMVARGVMPGSTSSLRLFN